jgi:hypothetical protein
LQIRIRQLLQCIAHGVDRLHRLQAFLRIVAVLLQVLADQDFKERPPVLI